MASATVLAALVSHWATDATLATAVPGGVWLGEVPEKTALPLAVIVHNGEDLDRSFENYMETTSVQFIVVGTSAATIDGTIVPLVKALFDDCEGDLNTAVITGQTVVSMVRKNYVLSLEDLKAPDGKRVYAAYLDYTVEISRARP